MDDLKKFSESFFKNLKCRVEMNGKIMVVENVPKSFEDFAGKKAPYYLAFDPSDVNDDKIEIVNKSNFLVRAMASYLGDRGQTTLLKIEFDENPEEQIKNCFTLKNCNVFNPKRQHENNFIIRFTFMTTFQYLNEKEQVMNNLYVQNGRVIEFNSDKYKLKDGNKKELEIKDVKEDYNVAKDFLKSELKEKISDVGNTLKIKLEKELNRINEHYSRQLNEIYSEINKNKETIKELESHIGNGKDEEIKKRIEKLMENISKLEGDEKKEKLEKEKEFFINDEKHKHSLNIDNKLVNTSIIYYPVYKFNFMLKNADSGSKEIELKFNPVTGEIGKINCESCNEEVKELKLCLSGHISCDKCLECCPGCMKCSCKLCRTRVCSQCSKNLCKKCGVQCKGCLNYMCKMHLRKTNDGKELCSNCIKICSECHGLMDKYSVKKCPNCKREMCEKCSLKNIRRENGKLVCNHCVKECKTCGRKLGIEYFQKIAECKCKNCSDLDKCKDCRKAICPMVRSGRA